jgi:hypothetical protein
MPIHVIYKLIERVADADDPRGIAAKMAIDAGLMFFARTAQEAGLSADTGDLTERVAEAMAVALVAASPDLSAALAQHGAH